VADPRGEAKKISGSFAEGAGQTNTAEVNAG
jgi:hypothetical protein